jgi:hypothetical protein
LRPRTPPESEGEGHVKTSRGTTGRFRRLVGICESLPDVQTAAIGRRSEHRSFLVRKKILAYYLVDHHGDGRIALWCKAAPGEQGRLVDEDPRRFFVPPYLGHRGWVGVRLDLGPVDWAQVAYLVRNAYRLTASRSQIARME